MKNLMTLVLIISVTSCLPKFRTTGLHFKSSTKGVRPVVIDPDTTPGPSEPTEPTEPLPELKTFQEIMDNQCIACHSKTLADPIRMDRWLSGPGTEASKIVRSVHEGRMPKDKPALPVAQVDIIREHVTNYQIKVKIFAEQCMACHSKTFNDPERLARWIVPGKPDESKLYLAVVSGRMPKDKPALSADQITALRIYIENLR